ncbi:hypothetical protein CR513_54344, partial [Mucuna pruriens]
MKEFGYKQSQGDHTLFIKYTTTGGVIALLVYVDDIIITRNDEKEKSDLKIVDRNSKTWMQTSHNPYGLNNKLGEA